MDKQEEGYFDDNGNHIYPTLTPKPDLCVNCKKDDLTGEEKILCELTRLDQKYQPQFQCEAYEPQER